MDVLSLQREVKAVVAKDTVAAGTTSQDTAVIDMAQDGGYDGIQFVTHLGTVTDGSVITATLKESVNADGSASSSPTGGATAAHTGATSSGKFLMNEYIRPTKRYVFLTVTRTTQNAGIASVMAYLFRARTRPVTQDAKLIDRVQIAGQ